MQLELLANYMQNLSSEHLPLLREALASADKAMTPETTVLPSTNSGQPPRSNSSSSNNKDTKRARKKKGPHCETCGREEGGEKFMRCIECKDEYHPSCLDIKPESVNKMKSFGWKCVQCKKCEICKDSGNEEKLLFCDSCDRGYHTFCLKPPLSRLPTGGWFCADCVECKKCGARVAAGLLLFAQSTEAGNGLAAPPPSAETPGPSGREARWHADYTLCEACYQRFIARPCAGCKKNFRERDALRMARGGMLQCTACGRYLHPSCEKKDAVIAPACPRDQYKCPDCRPSPPPSSSSVADDTAPAAATPADPTPSNNINKRQKKGGKSSASKRSRTLATQKAHKQRAQPASDAAASASEAQQTTQEEPPHPLSGLEEGRNPHSRPKSLIMYLLDK